MKFVINIALAFLGALLLMIGVGMWHAEHSSIPTMSYGVALVISIGLSIAASEARDE